MFWVKIKARFKTKFVRKRKKNFLSKQRITNY